MNVRWKPLLVLSGLFLVIAVLGLIALMYTPGARGSADILPLARAERDAEQFAKAKIHYQRALQKDPKNAAIHEELASMFAEWEKRAPADKRREINGWRLISLMEASKFGKKLLGPRRQLLGYAMQRDEAADAVFWAKEVLALEPKDVDAHYVLAADLLEARSPAIPEIKRHLEALKAAQAAPVRLEWLGARLAQVSGDDEARERVLQTSRSMMLPADADPVDRMALLRLRALDVQTTEDPSSLSGRVAALQAEARTIAAGPELAPARINRLSVLLERVQKSLLQLAAKADPEAKAPLDALCDAIEGDVEAMFRKAVAVEDKQDLGIYLTYADHLRFREKRARCLEVVEEGLRDPLATRAAAGDAVMGLHAVAIESLLSDLGDAARFDQAALHIKALLGSTSSRYQGLGHLFQGAIDLERSGVAGVAARSSGPGAPSGPPQPKLRASALNHLKVAATQLPELAEAQARYGVALVLSQEQGLGRQYLQKAMKLGNLDPQYQIWAAWSIVQAGYPEEAEPIVTALLGQVAQGRQSREMQATLLLLSGEIHQARRTPDDLKKALAAYEKAIASGHVPTPSVQLRLAQIDVQLGQSGRALARIEAMQAKGQGVPSAEHLAVLILLDLKKDAEARARLDKARRAYPQNSELVGLDASLRVKAKQPQEADRLLADFLVKQPEDVGIVLMRAQLLAERLNKEDEARNLLVNVADRSDISAPLVQLALLDLKRRDYQAVASTVAKIRKQWGEAAAGDLLEAQVALDQGDISAAVTHFDAALKKDPNNKLVQFWKAQLDSRNGSSSEAARALEAITKDRPTKEIDPGLSLMAAAQSALANLALQNGDLDGAIHRFEDLRKGDDRGSLARSDRWQLVAAYSARDQWPSARREIAALLGDPKAPPKLEERVRAANFYRLHKEEAAALGELDAVLKKDPAQPAAVVTRASMLVEAKKLAEASSLLRTAIAATPAGQEPPAVFFLMLAAVENLSPPTTDGMARALATLERGLLAQPDSLDLVRAKYRVLRATRDPKAALAFIKAKAEGDKGALRGLLVEVYREQGEFAEAEAVVRTLRTEHPKDAQLAVNLVRLVALQAIDAAERNDRARERTLNEKTATLIREFRAQFPHELAFLQADCDLAARRGDMARATAITQEMDQVGKSSPAGSILRARLYAAQGRTREAADAYGEALNRNPRQPEIRVLLGQARLKLGETDEAVRQAKLVLDADRDRPDALLLQARALAGQTGPAGQVAAGRSQAIALLTSAIEKRPTLAEAYHLIAEIQMQQQRRGDAIATLKGGLKANPDDSDALAQVVQRLTEPREDGRPPSPAELAEADSLATAIGGRDTKGHLILAVAVGYHKANQLDKALSWAEKAAKKLPTPIVHLNYGDLLLSLAESSSDEARSQAFYRRAVEQYDLVLKTQANSVEAINNKAWILHTSLKKSGEALALAQSLLKRVDPETLPGEFFDTLGTIQEGLNNPRGAEEAYAQGLRKSPDHPTLNFHMGKLIAKDRSRASKASGYLEKARAGSRRLSPSMADEVAALIQKVSRN